MEKPKVQTERLLIQMTEAEIVARFNQNKGSDFLAGVTDAPPFLDLTALMTAPGGKPGAAHADRTYAEQKLREQVERLVAIASTVDKKQHPKWSELDYRNWLVGMLRQIAAEIEYRARHPDWNLDAALTEASEHFRVTTIKL